MAKISDLRRKIALGLYELTSHAKLEMQDDGFSIEDVKHGIYSGRIVERQRDPFTSTKYCVRGKAADGRKIQLVCRLTELGYLRIITVFEE
ncbi:MAG: DUF4258 domain-containing protein [candidate division KSB1 bacterium]|nr:DUF4258 domain-containing protein [candidate division KSB1 bacterium]MDZ7313615.1 DUF4258 domain-containing protein [candidate division KSB1 bacterium]